MVTFLTDLIRKISTHIQHVELKQKNVSTLTRNEVSTSVLSCWEREGRGEVQLAGMTRCCGAPSSGVECIWLSVLATSGGLFPSSICRHKGAPICLSHTHTHNVWKTSKDGGQTKTPARKNKQGIFGFDVRLGMCEKVVFAQVWTTEQKRKQLRERVGKWACLLVMFVSEETQSSTRNNLWEREWRSSKEQAEEWGT